VLNCHASSHAPFAEHLPEIGHNPAANCGFAQINSILRSAAVILRAEVGGVAGQILWAVTLGAVFYAEYPDRWTLLGLAVIAVAGLFTFLREEQRFGWNRGIPVMRNRPGT
jgi:hypothetical protein